MTMISVDPTSPIPVSEQIRSQLLDLIRNGTLGPGTRLPTVRQLAADLGVATNTVTKVFAALERDGLVVANRRQGTVVQPFGERTEPQRRRALADATVRYVDELTRLGVSIDEAITTLRALRPET